jgi:hypothetical protein
VTIETQWTSVPKTAIYEDCNLCFWKGKVWLPVDWVVPPPANYAEDPEEFNKGLLRRLVVS